MTTPETEVQETLQDTQVVEPEIAPDATPEAKPEGEAPDYQALYEEAKENAEKADQRARSIEGSVKSRREQDAPACRTIYRTAVQPRPRYLGADGSHLLRGGPDDLHQVRERDG